MKSNKTSCLRPIFCMLSLLSGSTVYAGTMGTESVDDYGRIYVGAFGGAGTLSGNDMTQSGASFYPEVAGGPLLVNAQGRFGPSSMWLIGGHLGYQWPSKTLRTLNNINKKYTFTPAFELEGYYIGGIKITGDDINSETARLDEHDFLDTYPSNVGVFLVNAILSVNASNFEKIHPYVGVGAGTSVISISDASSIQKSPPEPGVNHYDGKTDDTATSFAAQAKIGINFDLNQSANLFLEYRFLYLAANNYIFGPTIAPGHNVTTPWAVNIASSIYNMGTVGLQYDL
jgi:hypothetical protein